MLMPSIFGESLFDDFDNLMNFSFPDVDKTLYGKHAKNLMKTDVRETEDAYEVDIDLPGFKKDEVTITVENGYLNISAVKGLDKDETDKKTGKYIRQERYAGSCSRTFYVGETVEPEDVSAKFENGILQLHILKKEAKKVEIVRGPNIKFLPVPEVPVQHLKVPVSLKGGDNISTDDITPASAEFSSMRSNIPLMSKYCYHRYDPEFSERAREMGSSIIIGGENYGQGSSREHAAINPMYLGVKCVIAKSIARIHKGNLVNHGIVPMLFEDPADYEKIDLRDELEIENFLDQIQAREVEVKDVTKGFTFKVKLDLTDNELEVVLCGGQLRYLKRELVKQGVIDKE